MKSYEKCPKKSMGFRTVWHSFEFFRKLNEFIVLPNLNVENAISILSA